MVGLLAALGGVLLGFGLLSLLVALVQPLMPALLVWGNGVAGLLLLAVAAGLGFDGLRDRMRSGVGRRAGHGTNAVVSTVLILVLLGLLAFLSTRYSTRFDWTEQRVNTLSDQTLSVLDDLGEGGTPIEFTAFFREQDSPAVRDLLERYAYASPSLQLRFVDPNQRPDLVEAQQIAPEELMRGLLLISYGDQSVKVDQFSESELTNALVKLTKRARRKVYFLEGHNERKIGSPGDPAPAPGETPDVESAAGMAGFARAAAALRNEQHTVEPLLLATLDEVPEDADAVIIAGPTRPLMVEEREALERYLARGGALLVLVDPRARTNLYDDLRRWGIDVGDDVVVDLVMSVNRQPTAPVAEQYGQDASGAPHPIAEKLSRTVFSMVRSVRPVGEGTALAPLVLTSPSAWAERSVADWMKTGRAAQDDLDLAGPVSIAVAGTPVLAGVAADASPRIVVFGDSNFATNELIDVFSNRDLFVNTVDWLLGDVEHISVRPNVARSSTVTLTGGQLQMLQYLSLFVLPEGIALAGAVAWWLRRRAPSGAG